MDSTAFKQNQELQSVENRRVETSQDVILPTPAQLTPTPHRPAEDCDSTEPSTLCELGHGFHLPMGDRHAASPAGNVQEHIGTLYLTLQQRMDELDGKGHRAKDLQATAEQFATILTQKRQILEDLKKEVETTEHASMRNEDQLRTLNIDIEVVRKSVESIAADLASATKKAMEKNTAYPRFVESVARKFILFKSSKR